MRPFVPTRSNQTLLATAFDIRFGGVDHLRGQPTRADAERARNDSDCVRQWLIEHGMGIFLVLDELGKLLEHVALQWEREDVFVLQRLGELAARSAETPLVIFRRDHSERGPERRPMVGMADRTRCAR